MNIRYIFLTGFILFQFQAFSQYYDTFDCAVFENNDELQFAFTGGFDSPQFSSSDFNMDGKADIYVFDRNGSSSLVFLSAETGQPYNYELSRYYNKFFPKSLEGFCMLADFNGDGIDDLFSSGVSAGAAGVILHEAGFANDTYSYNQRRMGRPEGNPDIIWNKLPAGQVYCATTDIPAIVDVDHDGDLDILTFDEAGSYVYFCKNFQIERNLPSDTMDFEIADFCFGKFLESGLSQVITLSDNPQLCANKIDDEEIEDNKSGGAHSGSTVCAFDPDGDVDYDLLLGDLTYNSIVYLENGGDNTNAHMTFKDDFFPSYDESVDMPIFLAAFSLDVDDDGLEDILVAPNAQSSIRNVNNVWFYKNTGDPSQPYTLIQRDFLTEETIDYGSYSVPTFVDFNSDGLLDIVIGSGGPFDGSDFEISLVLLENTGSNSAPQYEIVDEDYLNFSQFSTTSSNPAPCFGDLDNDGDLDMVIGDEAGKLYYFENRAGAGNAFDFANPIYNWMDISAGQRIRPQLFDFNKDGLLDLIIGERNTNGYNEPATGEFVTGNLNYFQNQGTETEPFFDPEVNNAPNHPALGHINVSFLESASAKGGASPHFYNIGDKTFALVGSLSGRISLYEIEDNNPSTPAILLDDRVGGLVEGFYSAPTIADLNNDNVYEILIGNRRGGISLFQSDIMGTTSIEEQISLNTEIKIYPNPTSSEVTILTDSRINNIGLLDINGRRISDLNSQTDSYMLPQELTTGLYFLEIALSNGQREIEKLFVVGSN